MDKTNRLLTLRINYLRRQINLENFIILLTIVYFVFRYFTNPPSDDSVRDVDLGSCVSACGDKWGECIGSCHNQIIGCSYYFDEDEYKDNKCDANSANLSLSDCDKLCRKNMRTCSDRCRTKYNIYSSILITPN